MIRKLCLLLLIPSIIQAQKIEFTGKLLDAKTKAPIVYANLSFLNSEKGISTTEEGIFSMILDKKSLSDKIHISCLNYKDTIVTAQALQKSILYLKPKTEVLDEILLSRKLERTVELDPVKGGIISMHSRGLRMVAKYFPNTKKNQCCSYLTKVTIEFPRRINKKSKFRFRIFDVDVDSGKPKDDLLVKNIPITIKEDQIRLTLDLTDQNIKIPKEGFFVAFEKLFIPYNKYGNEENGFYSPIIGVSKSRFYKRNISRNYIYTRGNWMELPYTKRGKLRGYVPSISVTLSN